MLCDGVEEFQMFKMPGHISSSAMALLWQLIQSCLPEGALR